MSGPRKIGSQTLEKTPRVEKRGVTVREGDRADRRIQGLTSISGKGNFRTGAAQSRKAGRKPKFMGRRVRETPAYRLQQHLRAVESAQAKVTQALLPFQRESALSIEALSSRRQRTWTQRTVRFAKAMDGFEKARRSLLSNRSCDKHNEWTRKYGADNPETQEWTKLCDPQLKALETFLRRFSGVEGLGLKPGTLEQDVNPASESVLMALSGAIRSLHSSIDPKGAANIDHLATVYRGVLEQEAEKTGGPLSQAVVDKLAFNTVCTDVWMKGQSVDILSAAKTAPTTAGKTGAEVYAHMKSQVKARFKDVDADLRPLIDTWIDRGFVPMDPNWVEQEGKNAGLNDDRVQALKDIWGGRIMASGDFFNIQGFMLGVWLHGIPAFDSVKNTVDSAGKGRTDPQEVYYAVLGHHMAGFIAAGFARGNVKVNFAEMERRGELPSGAGDKLSALYESAIGLAAKWRPIIDTKKSLNDAQRSEYRQDADILREALRALPEDVRSQLLNDDAMQFTPIGLEKWLNMTKGNSNAQLVTNLYEGPVQGYLEEQLARDLSDPPGAAFIDRSAEAATNLGVVLDRETQVYRLAKPNEPEYAAYAKRILSDDQIRAEIIKDPEVGTSGVQNPKQLYKALGPETIVEWHRSQAPDAAALLRLART